MTITTIHPQIDKVLDKLFMAHKIYNQIVSSENCPNRNIYRELAEHTDEILNGFADVFKIDRSEIELDFLEKSKLTWDQVGIELHGLLIEYSNKKVLEYCINYEEQLNAELREAIKEAAFVKEEKQVLANALITSTSFISTLRLEHETYQF
ncbi:MAG: hypothetical protein R8G66_23955 [Cytophagales bacterium]|nr:hypothetical protein [Cytophagales bacterium]